MIKLIARRSRDVTYLTEDPARELDGVRDGGPRWWVRAGTAREVGDVLTGSARSGVVGYDLVVAAPRPISVLVALDEASAPGVVAAHRAAVADAMDYLERRALVVRVRAGGLDLDLPARFDSVAAFTHGLNRHGEPHLHDHVVVGSVPARSTHVLDARSLRAHLPAADALYRSSLRAGVRARTPWRAWRSFRGVEMVAGLDEGYRALWAGHHEERGDKLHWSRAETLDAWRRDLRGVVPVGEVRAPPARDTIDEHAFGAALEGVSAPARRHLVAAWADAAVYGQSALDAQRSLDDLYPELRGARGVREPSLSLSDARMTGRVRERGARPLGRAELGAWAQRSRELEMSRSERSR